MARFGIPRDLRPFVAFLGVLLVPGCVYTNYPVIFDTRGADAGAVVQSFYDAAYIVPTSTVAILWADGSDEVFTEVTQDWKGDQWLYGYNNFDPTGQGALLDQRYCDPVHEFDCWFMKAWNPDIPDWSGYEWPQPPDTDDPFDYIVDLDCSGARTFDLLLDTNSRLGECGSGLWADKQALAEEFSLLARTTWRGRDWYHVPIDAGVASFVAHGADGSETPMPLYGRFNLYLDERLRAALPVTPNMRHQLAWLAAWREQHGPRMDLDVTYGSLTARFQLSVRPLGEAIGRL